MAGKVRHLLERDGRYYARIVVPLALRPFLENKTELRTPLGADYRGALKAHPAAVAELQYRIHVAEVKAEAAGRTAARQARFPMTVAEIALRSYHHRLQQDEDARASNHHYARMSIDDGYVERLRKGIAGALSDDDLGELVGHRIAYFRMLGNTDAAFGSAEWRELARALCTSEYEALERTVERDEGDYTGRISNPMLISVASKVPEKPPVSLSSLFTDHIASRKLLGKGAGSEARWSPVFKDLRKFLGHDDARRLTKKDVMTWRDNLLLTRAPKTVRDVFLAALRAVLNWAVREDRLTENVADEVRQEIGKLILNREKGFTDAEAQKLLEAAWNYTRGPKEFEKTAAAKRWIPFLCAFTGARVTEMTQLRKQDVQNVDGTFVLRVTPDSGTVKSGKYRDVPVHQQLIDLGFLDFVKTSGPGPLFYNSASPDGSLDRAKTVSGRVTVWLHDIGVIPAGVQPNHGWRHRFRTVARELGVSEHVVDSICGHAGRTIGDHYGDATIKAKLAVIKQFPAYELKTSSLASAQG